MQDRLADVVAVDRGDYRRGAGAARGDLVEEGTLVVFAEDVRCDCSPD
ncbi:MAG TPA: hypothetical protein PKK74_08800 [Candidatus Methanoculleus thermohydrogenotrophicum]|nr:hypothetical protein [Candidatus Methanoculleus thermohydrogenotrophicum]NLM81133.1 hypothetical protein [Candidatus Methanoculleus thermohydrogenotrophicum]HOB18772.1 hypothetical protein [Candidatus Methanoculleus thermohydrogenotrophicum]HPZ38831.1 hypothetical protein [Candidatus Methanoculleus thermohydrogenotrophicum]